MRIISSVILLLVLAITAVIYVLQPETTEHAQAVITNRSFEQQACTRYLPVRSPAAPALTEMAPPCFEGASSIQTWLGVSGSGGVCASTGGI
jgi:hypothetical protein